MVINIKFIDKPTEETLEIQYILNEIHTMTPYGKIYKEKIRAFLPGEEAKLVEELEKIEVYMEYVEQSQISREINNIFYHIKDLKQSVKKANGDGILSEVELFELKQFLFLIRELDKLLENYHIPIWGDMKIQPIGKLEKLLDPEGTGIATFYIYDSYSEELTKIRQAKRDAGKSIKQEKKLLKENIESKLNIKLKPDNTILISKIDEELIKKLEANPNINYISETYMNIKYGLKPTDEINLLERHLTILKDKEEREELKIREKLSREIGKHSKTLFANMASIGKMDLILAKAKLAVELNAVKPKIVEEHYIKIIEGRHPIVEKNLKAKGLKFTPITIELGQGVSCITGANMGGKTVSLKLVGLLSTMAQYGLMVPAAEMELGLNEFIKTSIGDLQTIDKGLSTFGGEIKRISEAVEISSKKGLILIDELARGTNPEEGYAISKALVEYLKNQKSITLITTHYDNIGNTEGVSHLQVVGLSNVDFCQLETEIAGNTQDKMDIINKYMDYRLKIMDNGKAETPRDAINIAKIMGLKEEILKLAEQNISKGR